MVFFWVSVAMIILLLPVVQASEKLPNSNVFTCQRKPRARVIATPKTCATRAPQLEDTPHGPDGFACHTAWKEDAPSSRGYRERRSCHRSPRGTSDFFAWAHTQDAILRRCHAGERSQLCWSRSCPVPPLQEMTPDESARYRGASSRITRSSRDPAPGEGLHGWRLMRMTRILILP